MCHAFLIKTFQYRALQMSFLCAQNPKKTPPEKVIGIPAMTRFPILDEAGPRKHHSFLLFRTKSVKV
ncbi:MAG TPA: hypothetical protein DD706_02710 [Nitrospiraceae bacterium]|nr:hypothetical protein [Nitrospiraceae bacterium]